MRICLMMIISMAQLTLLSFAKTNAVVIKPESALSHAIYNIKKNFTHTYICKFHRRAYLRKLDTTSHFFAKTENKTKWQNCRLQQRPSYLLGINKHYESDLELQNQMVAWGLYRLGLGTLLKVKWAQEHQVQCIVKNILK